MNRVKKYTFTLTGVNISRINSTYGISSSSTETIEEDKKVYMNTTKLSELNTIKGTPEVISFLDESKRLHVCQVSMIDMNSRMNVNLLRYHCFWCRHPFDTLPIACPIKYVPSQLEKTYTSNITKDSYTIKENITTNLREKLQKNEKKDKASQVENISIKYGEYYETFGIYCSFNCCKAWINDNKHIRLYDHSDILLMKMYNNIMGTKTVVINPAPNWILLEQYGGNLNIMKFREGFNKIDYEYHGYTKNIPNFLPLGSLFEEKIKF